VTNATAHSNGSKRAYDRHDLELRWLEIDPFLRNIRADPRYVALPKKMKLPLD
jgi:hypothetical protein